MINNLNIIVFDFETGGLKPDFHEAIQIAGKAYNGRTLEPYPVESGGEFNSLMKPLHPERLEDGALNVNKITREQLENAPDQGVVWNNFVEWVGKYNIKGASSIGAPIGAGKNIRNFDMKFADVLNKKHCKKKDKTVLFNRILVDLEDIIFFWFENEVEPENHKQDTLLKFFNMDSTNAHDALTDVKNCGTLIIKFLKLHRELQKRVSKDGSRLIKWRAAS